MGHVCRTIMWGKPMEEEGENEHEKIRVEGDVRGFEVLLMCQVHF